MAVTWAASHVQTNDDRQSFVSQLASETPLCQHASTIQPSPHPARVRQPPCQAVSAGTRSPARLFAAGEYWLAPEPPPPHWCSSNSLPLSLHHRPMSLCPSFPSHLALCMLRFSAFPVFIYRGKAPLTCTAVTWDRWSASPRRSLPCEAEARARDHVLDLSANSGISGKC